MKGWKWSNGEAVDASDVVFWLNMMKAEPGNYYGYVAGPAAGQPGLLQRDRRRTPWCST